jgi:hypothetical protein
VFYLGRRYSLDEKQVKTPYCLYDSKDMAAHALCLGQKGSGKTGLCIGLIEEAAIDGIPVIAIDTKGDVGNVLLQFPQMTAEDLMPWLDLDKVRRSGLPPPVFAAQQAKLWQIELTSFEETSARIQRLKDSADFVIYTPGSSAGLQISLSGALLAPSNMVLGDNDIFRERIGSCTSALLALVGIVDDSQRSRDHVLLSNIIKTAWQSRQDLTLPNLIKLIQQPNIAHIGAFDMEQFYPAGERLQLALALNNLLASLSFEALLTGEAINIDDILHGPIGKPKVSVISIAHLAEHERMFFVSELLSELISWMRTQADTNSLRAMLFVDELADYFPSRFNLPSKRALSTLMKYGRKHGLGLLLSSQRPADLDYNGLIGVGTWFLGQLKSESDRTQLFNGLELAASNYSVGNDRVLLDKTISELEPRVFVMNNIAENQPVTFLTRWTLSYLRGPMSPEEIKAIMLKSSHGVNGATPIVSTMPAQMLAQAPPAVPQPQPQPQPAGIVVTVRNRPGAPSGVQECFLPVRQVVPPGEQLVYLPMLFAVGNVKYTEPAAGIDTKLQYCLLGTTLSGLRTIDWGKAQPAKVWMEDLAPAAEAGAIFEAVPAVFDDLKSYPFWTESFITWLCEAKVLRLLKCDATNEYSKPRESERNFRVRLSQVSREQRDQAAEAVKLKYLPYLAELNARLLQSKRVFEREEEGKYDHKIQSAVNLGTSVLGGYMGRKAATWATDHHFDVSGIAHKTGASRPIERTGKDERDIQSATETIEGLSDQIDDLNLQFGVAMAELERKFDPLETPLSEIIVGVTAKNVSVPLIALAWSPFFRAADGSEVPAWVRSAAATHSIAPSKSAASSEFSNGSI